MQTETFKRVEFLEQTLSRMPTALKIRLAALGSSGHRSILIRDANQQVARAVVRSPCIRESEIKQYSRFRSLSKAVVRDMALSPVWTKHYTVKLNLVQHPQCPRDISLRFLEHLKTEDVQTLIGSKKVPRAISKAAKRLKAKRLG